MLQADPVSDKVISGAETQSKSVECEFCWGAGGEKQQDIPQQSQLLHSSRHQKKQVQATIAVPHLARGSPIFKAR